MSDSQVRATEVREAYNCFRKAIYRCRNEANTQEEKSLYTNLIDTLSKVNYKIEALKSVSMSCCESYDLSRNVEKIFKCSNCGADVTVGLT